MAKIEMFNSDDEDEKVVSNTKEQEIRKSSNTSSKSHQDEQNDDEEIFHDAHEENGADKERHQSPVVVDTDDVKDTAEGLSEILQNFDLEERNVEKASQMKAYGNEYFMKKEYLNAIDYYTAAISLCPYHFDFEAKAARLEKEREKRMAACAAEREKRTKDTEREDANNNNNNDNENVNSTNKDDDEKTIEDDDGNNNEKEEFEKHSEFKKDASVFYSNRAACLLHLKHYDDALKDCITALDIQPKYLKALLRRAQVYEEMEKESEALKDYKDALEIDKNCMIAKKNIPRLQKICDDKMEKLKTETMGKLKDMGNSILGKFGLSTDNFQMVQDPNTGSYSINFNK